MTRNPWGDFAVCQEYEDQNAFSDRALQSDRIYDGFGRLAQSRTMESSLQWIATSEAYGALGLPLWTTNPVRNTDAYTNYSYDPLRRVTSVSYPVATRQTENPRHQMAGILSC